MSERGGPEGPPDPKTMPDRPEDTRGLYIGTTGVEEFDHVDTPTRLENLADPMDTVDAPDATPLDAAPTPQSPERSRGEAFMGAVGAIATNAYLGSRLATQTTRETAGRFAGHAKRYADVGANFAQEQARQAKEKAKQTKENVQTRAKDRAQRRYEKDFKDQVGNLADKRLAAAKEAKLVRDRASAAHHMGALVGHTLLVEPTEGRILSLASKFGLAPTEQERRQAVIAKYQADLDAAPGAPNPQLLSSSVNAAVEALKNGDTAEYDKQMKLFERDIAYNKNVAYTLDDKSEKFARERAAQFIGQEKARQAAVAEAAATLKAQEAAKQREIEAKVEARKAQIAGWEDPANVLDLKKAIEEEIRENHPGLSLNKHTTRRMTAEEQALHDKVHQEVADKYLQEYFSRSTEELDNDLGRHTRAVIPPNTQLAVTRLLNMSMTDLKQEAARKDKAPVVIETQKRVNGKLVTEKKTMPVKGPAIHRGVLLDPEQPAAITRPAPPESPTPPNAPDQLADVIPITRNGNERRYRQASVGMAIGDTIQWNQGRVNALQRERQQAARASLEDRRENEARMRRNEGPTQRNRERRARGEPEGNMEDLEELIPHPDLVTADVTRRNVAERRRNNRSPNPRVATPPQTTGRAAGYRRPDPRRYTRRSTGRAA